MGEIQTNRKDLSRKLAQAVTKAKKSPNLPHASRRARSFDVQGLEKTDAQLKERGFPSLIFAFHAGPRQIGRGPLAALLSLLIEMLTHLKTSSPLTWKSCLTSYLGTLQASQVDT